jgi:hypothetical protein
MSSPGITAVLGLLLVMASPFQTSKAQKLAAVQLKGAQRYTLAVSAR